MKIDPSLIPPNAIVGKTVAEALAANQEEARPRKATKKRGMNKLEAAWELELKADPQITHVMYEGITLKLAHDCRYSPDFMAFRCISGGITCVEFYETKGFRRDDAMVKLRVAASKFPMFRFFLVERKKDQWIVKEIQKS